MRCIFGYSTKRSLVWRNFRERLGECDTISLKKTTSSSRRLNVNILESAVTRYEYMECSSRSVLSSCLGVSSFLSPSLPHPLCPSLKEERQELMHGITRDSYQRNISSRSINCACVSAPPIVLVMYAKYIRAEVGCRIGCICCIGII